MATVTFNIKINSAETSNKEYLNLILWICVIIIY